jgi:hypothetical protein
MAKKNKPGKQLTYSQKNDNAAASLYGAEGVNAGNALINKFLQPGSLGRVSTDVGGENSLKRYSDLYGSVQGRDPVQTEVLQRMQAGLGGYTSPEYQAQREQMQRGVNSNYLTSAGQLMRAQSRGKVYGAASTAQLSNLQRSTQNQKDQMEQDLYIKNIDEMDRRNMEYGKYGRALNDEEYGRRAEATRLYGDEGRKLREETLDREKINLGQSNAELAAQIGAFTGAGAQSIAKQQNKKSYGLQKKGIDIVARM